MTMNCTKIILVFGFIFICHISISSTASKNTTKETQKAASLPPCAACTVLTDSFKKVIFLLFFKIYSHS